MSEAEKENDSVKELSVPLVDSWVETIAKRDLADILADLSEVGLDAITENEIVKEIPVVSTVVNVFKIGHTLRERAYMRKLYVFLRELENGEVGEEEKERYLQRITKNKRKAQHELEYVLALLDRIFSEQKAKLFSKLYLAYIVENIDWNMFCQISELIDRFLPGDVDCLNRSVLKNDNRSEMENIALQRLQGLGVVKPNSKPGSYDINGNVLSTLYDGTYSLTSLGRIVSNTLL